MIFANRQHAGEILAKKFSELKFAKKRSIVASIPRGGVVVGQVIAEKLGIGQTVIVIKKLGAPQNPELAIGATASFGKPVLDRWLIEDLKISSDYLKKEIIKKKKEAFSRERLLGVKLIPSKFKAKIVIVVDDGLATGQTAKAAAKIIRKFGPQQLILGVACAAPSTLDLVKNDYDEVICPLVSSDFWAVGQFYRDFRPITDEEVIKILNE